MGSLGGLGEGEAAGGHRPGDTVCQSHRRDLSAGDCCTGALGAGRSLPLSHDQRMHLPGRAVQAEGTVRRRHRGVRPPGLFGTWQWPGSTGRVEGERRLGFRGRWAG